jgi:DNA-binding protein
MAPKTTNDNEIFVGKKTVMYYVMAIVARFDAGTNDVVVRARGNAISHAVDAVEVTRNRYMPNVQVADIEIGTDRMQGKHGNMVNVSWIKLSLKRR